MSDLRSAVGFVSWQSDERQSPFCSPQHSICTGSLQDILYFIGHTLVLYLSHVSSCLVLMVALWFTSGHQCYTSVVLEADPVWCAGFLNEALSLPAYKSSF